MGLGVVNTSGGQGSGRDNKSKEIFTNFSQGNFQDNEYLMLDKKKGYGFGGISEGCGNGKEGGSGEMKIINVDEGFGEEVSRIEGKFGGDVSGLESSRRNLDFTTQAGRR